MVKLIFKDGTEKVVNRKRFSFIMGIKNIRSQLFTYEFLDVKVKTA